VLTHKIAGPLFKIGRYMSEMKEGGWARSTICDGRPAARVLRDLQADARGAAHQEEQDLSALKQIIETTERHWRRPSPS